jgi:hypothetical protein
MSEDGPLVSAGFSCEIVFRDGEQITVYGSIMGTLQDMKDMIALIACAGIARTNSAANSERRSLRLSAPQ